MTAAALDGNRYLNRKSSSLFSMAGSTTKLRNGFTLGMTDYTHICFMDACCTSGYNGHMEQWRPVIGFPDYEVSDHGSVRKAGGATLRAFCNVRGGYLRVSLYAGETHKTRRVHRLVLEAFAGPAPNGKTHGAHLDGNSTNNHFNNLQWKTPQENEDDKLTHGTRAFGEAVTRAQLTNQEAAELVASATFVQRKDGLALTNGKQLAKQYGISYNSARAIVWGRGYPSVARPYMKGKKVYA